MIIKYYIALVIAVFMLSCSGNSPETVPQGNAERQVPSNKTEQKSVISIIPENATVRSVIKLKVNDQNIRRSKIRWFLNETELDDARTILFSSNDLNKGDIVQAILYDKDKEYSSNTITIQNTPPVIRHAVLSPKTPTQSSRLTLDISSSDDDGDYIAYNYRWERNGEFIGEESYLDDVFKRGDSISIEITALDRDGSGSSIELKTLIYNAQPEISDSIHEFNGKQYKYQIAASDPDGDTLEFKLEQGPVGMTIDPVTGLVIWETGPDSAGSHEIKVSISDHHGGKVLLPFTTVISFNE